MLAFKRAMESEALQEITKVRPCEEKRENALIIKQRFDVKNSLNLEIIRGKLIFGQTDS
jgi:hypothetical protein